MKSVLVCLALVTTAAILQAQTVDSVAIRGHVQLLHVYGTTTGDPIIVSSGDGGWMHLGPHVAQALAAKGFYVIGFDVKAYLSGFTAKNGAVNPADEPGDFRVLAGLAMARTGRKPILVGVSEGAGLSVLAATDPRTKQAIRGVVALGLPDMNELAWRWKDSLIYLTHKVPNEPAFSSTAIIANVAPLPLAAIHSTHDEFVPVADVEHMMQRAGDPKQLWIVKASDHRFSDNLGEFDRRLLEAIDWVRMKAPR